MKLSPQINGLRSFTIPVVSRFLALLILTSFALTLLPIVSTSAEHSMPCCAGKSAEHCDSGLTSPKPRPVITEPMCGLPAAQPPSVEAPTTNPIAIESVAIEQECQMDCGACATVTSRSKRQKGLVHARLSLAAPATSSSHFDTSTFVYSSNENWTQINPRGPPAGC